MVLNILLIINALVLVGFVYAWREKGFLDLITIFLLFIWVILLIGGLIIGKINDKNRLKEK
jgi:hypothetical protein